MKPNIFDTAWVKSDEHEEHHDGFVHSLNDATLYIEGSAFNLRYIIENLTIEQLYESLIKEKNNASS